MSKKYPACALRSFRASAGRQKRIYFDEVVYFVTNNTDDWGRYFDLSVFCEVFIANLRLCKKMNEFYMYGVVVMPDHFHLLIQPFEAEMMTTFCFRTIAF